MNLAKDTLIILIWIIVIGTYTSNSVEFIAVTIIFLIIFCYLELRKINRHLASKERSVLK